MPPRKLDVWLDDVRPAPDGWTWCTSVHEVRVLIKRREVRRLSLDHDLGEHPGGGLNPTGYHLCLWMAETGKWPDECPAVHSQNPVGHDNIRRTIRSITRLHAENVAGEV